MVGKELWDCCLSCCRATRLKSMKFPTTLQHARQPHDIVLSATTNTRTLLS